MRIGEPLRASVVVRDSPAGIDATEIADPSPGPADRCESEALAMLRVDIEKTRQRFERQTSQNETWRQRIEQLSGQLRCLDADDRTLAETLRRSWS